MDTNKYFDINGVQLKIGQRVKFRTYVNGGKPVEAEGVITALCEYGNITVIGPEYIGVCQNQTYKSDVYTIYGNFDYEKQVMVFNLPLRFWENEYTSFIYETYVKVIGEADAEPATQ